MKKINILLALILCLTFVTCKKDIEPDMPKVTISKTDASANNVVISGTYEYSMEVTTFEILYSNNENMTQAQSVKITTEGNDFNVTIEDLNPNTTYYYCFQFTSKYNSAKTEKQNFKTLEEPEDPEVPEDPETINGYDYVDLGLPSGLKWATCNVGANNPEDYGDYFAWGETETKSDYSSTNSATFGLTLSDLQSQGYLDENDNLTSSYDAATANWGGSWRMPTNDELEELLNSCTWTWTTQNGVEGSIVTGPNGNSIFLPAAGYRGGSSLDYARELGCYWSSTPNESYSNDAYNLGFSSSYPTVNWYYRHAGFTVRAVSGEYIPGETIQLPTVTTNDISNITANSAVCGGNVTSDGGAAVTARGICWGTTQNPTINDNKTSDGSGTGRFTSNLINLNENTTYYVRAYATNEKGTVYGEEKSFKASSSAETINGYAYVDLGLPSGLKWATCNVGATSPEKYGDYFAWGETETKGDYSSTNSATFGLTLSDLQSQGYLDENDNLTSSYDAATANWGSPWRMPATSELNELLNSCTWTWTTQNGVNGYIVTGPNGNSIFLPAAGYYRRSSLQKDGVLGRYWSSTPDKREYDDISDRLGFDSSVQEVDWDYRYYGRSVRPVSGEYIPGETIQLPTVTTNDISNITANSAVCGGNVTSDGNGTVTARGICWSETQNPSLNSIYSEETNDGSGIGDFTSQLSNLKENTTYYVRAYATNEKGTVYGEEKSFKTSSVTGTINGYAYTDLGLPSGLKWATRNVRASSPEDYGGYYAWGETSTKTEYNETNSATHGIPMDDISGKAGYDVAKNSWGSTWRMPTKSEMEELLNNCTWEWITRVGVNGYKVTGPNGNHIFLPAAGWRSGDAFLSAGELGYYWSSTPSEDNDGLYSEYNTTAYRIGFGDVYEEVDRSYRYIGFTVRAVSE